MKKREDAAHSFHPQTNINKKQLSPNSIKNSENLYQRGIDRLQRKDEKTIARYHTSKQSLSTQIEVPPSLRNVEKTWKAGLPRTASPRSYLPGGKVWTQPTTVADPPGFEEFTQAQDASFQQFLKDSKAKMTLSQEQKKIENEENRTRKERMEKRERENERATKGQRMDIQLAQREKRLVQAREQAQDKIPPTGWDA